MDIFEWAEDNNWLADYYDSHTGRIYGCTEYKNDGAMPGIPVYEDGKFIGFAKKKVEEVKEN